jgi:hypothetical protein
MSTKRPCLQVFELLVLALTLSACTELFPGFDKGDPSDNTDQNGPPGSSAHLDAPYRVGLNFIKLDVVSKAEDYNDWQEVYADLRTLGAGGIRQIVPHDLGWHKLYLDGPFDDPDSYDFSAFDTIIDESEDLHIIPTLFQLGPKAPELGGSWSEESDAHSPASLYTPDMEIIDISDPLIKEKVRGYLEVVVNRYKDNILYYEIGNEIDVYGGNFSPELYAELLNFAKETIKRLDAESRVVLGGLSGTIHAVLENNLDWLDSVLTSTKNFDIINMHYYDRWHADEEGNGGLYNALVQLKELMAQHDISERPIWLSEVGSSNIGGTSVTPPHYVESSEDEQARDIFRKFSLAFGNNVALANWHTHLSSSQNPSEGWSGFGLRKSQGASVKAYHTYQLFSTELGDFTSCTALSQGDQNVWAYRYTLNDEDDGEINKWVAWTDLSAGASYHLSESTNTTVQITEVVSDSGGTFTTQSLDPANLTLTTIPILITE